MESLTLPAFAKINLYLRVLGQRADGYHELDTIFQTVSLHDNIIIEATSSPEINLRCDDDSLSIDQDNLIYRAAKALQRKFAPACGANIYLDKRIPVSAGLGGGSSDAAITLIGLTHLWKAAVPPDDLLSIAASLGADVSFFFYGGTARGTGTGNNIAVLPDIRSEPLLIVKPNAGVSTAQAYETLDSDSLTSANQKTILCGSPHREVFDTIHLETGQNDFEAVVIELAPEIERAKAVLSKAGAKLTMLAGSGAAVFGSFENEDAQGRAIQAIELEAGWRVFPCRTVARGHYRRAMGAASSILERFCST